MNTFLEHRKFIMKDTTTTMTEPPTIEQARSGIALENLQEVLDAEDNAGWTLHGGQNQYFTPAPFARECYERLVRAAGYPNSVLDPQCGTGALLHDPRQNDGAHTFGIDIDNRLSTEYGDVKCRITGHCVKAMAAFDDLYPGTRWDWVVANPPFGKRWKINDKPVDSTLHTWLWAIGHGYAGYLISNANTIEKLALNKHEWVFDYWKRTDVWENVEVPIGVVFWKSPNRYNVTPYYQLEQRWESISKVLDAEKGHHSDWNIYLDHNGMLRTYLSLRHEIKLKLTREQITRLAKINKCHPLTLTTEKESRALLKSFVDAGIYSIEPKALEAINDALSQVSKMAVPLMPVTDFERVAYADEEDSLECIASVNLQGARFTAGRKYPLKTGTYKFTKQLTRRKPHYNEETGENYVIEHDCQLTGQDRFIAVRDDSGKEIRFMESPQEPNDRDEALLWTIFKKPEVKTVTEAMPDMVQHYTDILKGNEMLAGFEYYPGQLTFIPRVACKDQALIGSATGTGKTLIALSILACKGPERALIIAPQGCVRAEDSDEDEDGVEYHASQWISEIQRFAPYLQIWELFSMEDYNRILALNGGKLPPGVYVTYYDAFFRNKARETAPPTWDDTRLQKELNNIAGTDVVLPEVAGEPRYFCDAIGSERDGIRCIVTPSMSTLIGNLFDMVLCDECHIVTNLDAAVTQMLIRLQPKYRYAFTATPIPNIITNLFSLMGWICVDDWYKGGRRNARWPFARSDLKFFENTFMCLERDFTQERLNKMANPKNDKKVIRKSPVISAPARLLKLLKPSMAYAGKHDMNPDYKDARLVDVRVEMGQEQARLYHHFLDRGNIPALNALVRARKQVQWLRGICADPKGFYREKPKRLNLLAAPEVKSNMNPKVIATLELVRDILAKGEQVLIISSRVGLTDTIEEKLVDAGIPVGRIDSTVPADQHALQSNLFKARRVPVMLMGIKCAMAHSFPQCIYEIITSIEYSPGSLNQAKGRIDRVNSRPGVTVYCILHKWSIEELMHDICAIKDDAATICLLGKRIPRNFVPVDAREILANAIECFDLSGSTPEPDCESKWPILRKSMKEAMTNYVQV